MVDTWWWDVGGGGGSGCVRWWVMVRGRVENGGLREI